MEERWWIVIDFFSFGICEILFQRSLTSSVTQFPFQFLHCRRAWMQLLGHEEPLSWHLWGRRWICPSSLTRNKIIAYLRNLPFFPPSFVSGLAGPAALSSTLFYYTSPRFCHSYTFPALLPLLSHAKYHFGPSQPLLCGLWKAQRNCVRFR